MISAFTHRQREMLLLALILIAGMYFRFTGLNWDGGHHLHPDERFLTMVEGAIQPGEAVRTGREGQHQVRPAPLWEIYFDTQRSALNPNNVGYGFYVYGTFPLFAVRLVAGLMGRVGYDQVHLLGRMLSGLADLVTVALVYAIARRLYGGRVGVLAAALVAFCVMHIQQAHFFVFDSFLVTLVAAAFWFCVDIAETGRLRSYALTGLFLGLAMATKLSMAVFAVTVALAGLIYVWRAAGAGTGVMQELRTGLGALVDFSAWERRNELRNNAFLRMITGGLIAIAVAALTFRIFQPYAFAGPGFLNIQINPAWWQNIKYQLDSQAGTVDLPPSIQWAGTEPLLFPWRHMVMWGMGFPMGLAAWAGFVAAGAVVLLRGKWQHLLLVAWTGLCFVYFGSVLNKTMRYLLPMYPFIIILGAWGLVALYDWARAQRLAVLNGGAGGPHPPSPSPTWGEEGYVQGAVSTRWQRLRPLVAQYGPGTALGLLGLVVASSALWSFAFTRIYTRPTTRVAASEWIYQNVPRGARMANEHWDDPLPLPIPGRDHGVYAGAQLPLYDPDEPRKIDTLVRFLTESDYINVTSNRLYGSIPRIPQRYPMSTEYYRRLFAGDLGFQLVHTEASYPTLGPWTINDDHAEEAFTVYDHPKVLIFKKQPDFSPDRVRQLLSAVPLDNVQQIPPIQVGKPTLVMPEWLRAANVAGGTWADQFSLGGATNALGPLLWYLAIQAFGLLMAPLLWLGLGRLPDRGYGVSKPIGLLAVSWLGWTLAGYRVLPWTRLTLLLSVLALGAVAAVAARRYGAAWLAWMRAHRRLILTSEAVFLAAYLLVLLFRAANPDLWHPARGGEKPMEFSYLNAVIRTTYFPPYDPWYAGGYLNYYYFGYVLVAALTKLTGVMPSIGFNLAVALLYALTAAAGFSFAYNLARLGGRVGLGSRWPLGAGVAGVVCVALLGNLDGFSQLLERLGRTSQVGVASPVWGVAGFWNLVTGLPAVLLGGAQLEQFDFWRSSRIINGLAGRDNTINEFPFWTFLFADLHAHLISIPFQATTLVVLLNAAYGGRRPFRTVGETAPLAPPSQGEGGTVNPLRWAWSQLGWWRLAEIVFLGWLVGALYVINTWEFPTYMALTAATFLLAEVSAQRGLTLAGAVRAVVSAAGVLLIAKPLFRPFWQWYVTFYSSVTLWTQDKSRLDHYLVIHGLFVFSLLTLAGLLAGAVWRRTGWGRYVTARWNALGRSDRFSELERALGVERQAPAEGYVWLICLTLLGSCLALAWGSRLSAVLFPLLGLFLAVAWERRDSPALLFASLLAATGTALSIFVEFVALQGDIGRMNTVFKFYLQIWTMWALVSGVALTWGAERLWSAARSAARLPAAEPTYAAHPAMVYDDPVAAGAGDGTGEEEPPLPLVAPRAGALAGGESLAGYSAAPVEAHTAVPSAKTPGVSWWTWSWAALGGFLLLASLAYPLGATPARLADRFTPLPPTLDGMAYMPYATIEDSNSEVRANNPRGATISGASDYAAIRWLLENVQGSPVILEASVPEYRWGNRVSKYTGLPAVLGWRWHQSQQRGTYGPQVDQRLRDVQLMYADANPSRLRPLLDKYGVRYIYVGDLERAYYSAAGIAKFDQMSETLRPVYREGGVTIYEVVSNVR